MNTNTKTWGYRKPESYLPAWNAMQEHFDRSKFVLVDWGSDAGWYSIKIAERFPESTVISVDAGTMLGSESIELHHKNMNELGIQNNILVNCFFGAETFRQLRKSPPDYQLVLNVFHWIGSGYGKSLNGPREWDRVFCDLISAASMTFFEVPNEDHPGETPHRIREWYDGRDVATVLRDALSRNQVRATVQLLDEICHAHKGRRKLFKITLDTPVEAADGHAVAENIMAVGRTIKPTMYRRFKSFASRLKIRLTGKTLSGQ